jgi:hypothetical protein
MPQPLYPQGVSPHYPLDKRLDGLSSWSEHGGKEKKSYYFLCQELKPRHPDHSLITILTELPQLLTHLDVHMNHMAITYKLYVIYKK